MATRTTRSAGALLASALLLGAAGAATAQPVADDPPALTPPGAAPLAAPLAVPLAVVDEPVPRPFAGPRFQVSAGLVLRVTRLDGHAPDAVAQLDDYGWIGARAPTMYGFGVEGQFLLAPIVDLGLSWQWSRGDHGRGSDPDDVVRTDVSRLGATARLHWAMGRPFVPEPRVDVGLVRERLVVHRVSQGRTHGYLRVGVDWRLGTRRVGAQLALGYTMTTRAPPGALDPAIGGLDLAVGPYYRF